MKKIDIKDAPWWEAKLEFIGQEQMPLLIIDNFFPKPDILIKDANRKTFIANAPYFPGIRAVVPHAYFTPLMKGLSDVLVNIFGYSAGIDMQECHYSITTIPGTELNMVQRIPHVDGGDDSKVALLHYLCEPKHGGTAFYRQTRTGFETVSNRRFQEFNAAVHKDHNELGPSIAEYYSGSDKRFEMIKKIDAKFNTAIMYFSRNLHSIDIAGGTQLNSNPSNGRLTINSFFNSL